MSTSWHAVFGLPETLAQPDLYHVIGLDRRTFDPALLDKAFKTRMQQLEAKKSLVERSVFEEMGGELVRARRVLGNAQHRAAYDRDLITKRSAKLRKVVESTLAGTELTLQTEKTIVSSGLQLGYSESEVRDVLRAQLTQTQAASREPKKKPTTERGKPGATKPGTGHVPKPANGAGAKPATDSAKPADAKPANGAGSRPAPESAPRPKPTPKPQPTPPTGGAKTELDLGPKPKTLVGTTIDNKYEVISLLGAGGMGSVFKARHTLLDKLVALKVVSPHLSMRQDVRERFLREARAAMEFVHPNAVPLRDFGHTGDGLLFMTQDFSPGETLAQITSREGPLPIGRAFAIVRQCLLALGEAHRKGIVHRDIKPDNILVENDDGADHARVCDFGIAKITDGGNGDTGAGLTGGAVIGTPHYMAPEQGAGDKVDARADLYACGCVLSELLTGQKVFDADTAMQIIMMHVTQAPPVPSKLRRGLSKEIDDVVAKALAKSPRDRYQSAEEFVAAIDALPVDLPGRIAPEARPRAAIGRPSERLSAAQLAAQGSSEVKKPGTDFDRQKFCDKCGGSVPEKWHETRAARRVGTKLVCASCWAPVAAGKSCLGCLTPITAASGAIAAGSNKRICKACSKSADLLRECRGCKVLLPTVAFERGDAFAVGNKSYCKDCYRARRKKV